MSNNSRRAAKSVILITIFTLASKFLGFLREVLIAAKYGSNMETDTFFIAFTVTLLIAKFFRESIRTTFIPVISDVESKEGKEGKLEHTSNMINLVFIASFLVVGLSIIASPIIIRLFASAFRGEQFDLAVRMTRIGLPSVLFAGVIGIMVGYLQSEEKFYSTAILGIPLNLAYIGFLILLSPYYGVTGLMVALVVGTILQLIIQIPELKTSGFKYKLVFKPKDEYLKKVLYLSLPVLVSVGINDLNILVDRTLASTLVDGSISVLNYSDRLIQLILGVFIMAITTVIFPMLSKEANKGDMKGLKKTMGYGVNLVLLITIPAAVGMIVLARPIVEVAFQRGEFVARDTIMTSQALIFYSVGLVAMSLRLLLERVYYSLQDTRSPMINAAISVGFNIVFNLILIRFMAHAGLALGTSLGMTIATILLFYGLKKKIGSLGTMSYIKCGLKAGLASAIMGVAAYMIYHGLTNILAGMPVYKLIALLVAIVVGATIYLVLCYLLKIEEITITIDKIKERLNNKSSP